MTDKDNSNEEVYSDEEQENSDGEVRDNELKSSYKKPHKCYAIKIKMTQVHIYRLYLERYPNAKAATYCKQVINYGDNKPNPELSHHTFCKWVKEYKTYIESTNALADSEKFMLPLEKFYLDMPVTDKLTIRFGKNNINKELTVHKEKVKKNKILSSSPVHKEKNKKKKIQSNKSSSNVLKQHELPISIPILETSTSLSVDSNNNSTSNDTLDTVVRSKVDSIWNNSIGYTGNEAILDLLIKMDPALTFLRCNKFLWNHFKSKKKLILNKFYTLKFLCDIDFNDRIYPLNIMKSPSHYKTIEVKEDGSTNEIIVKRLILANVSFGSYIYDVTCLTYDAALSDFCKDEVIKKVDKRTYFDKEKKMMIFNKVDSVPAYIKFTSKTNGEIMFIHICDIRIRDVEIKGKGGLVIKNERGIETEHLVKELEQIMEIDDSDCYFRKDRSLDKSRVSFEIFYII